MHAPVYVNDLAGQVAGRPRPAAPPPASPSRARAAGIPSASLWLAMYPDGPTAARSARGTTADHQGLSWPPNAL